MKTNRNHKDRLFIKLFGEEETKGNLLELYNALNNTEYTDEKDLTLTTIDNVIYMGYKNDVSFIISNELVLYEHQSSLDPNMPLRGLVYFAKQCEKYIATQGIALPTSRKIFIPEPRYYVLYNGKKDIGDEEVIKLSDSYMKNEHPGEMEWTAHLININYGKNKKLLKKCKILEEYAILIDTIRKNIAVGEDQENAIPYAVDECIEKGVLKDFLIAHKAEVIGMILTEWNEEKFLQQLKKEYTEDGEERGKHNQREKDIDIIRTLKNGKSVEDIAKELSISVEEVQAIADAMK